MSDFYWPGPDDLGVYDLVHHSGVVLKSVMWTGANWVAKGPAANAMETRQMMEWGYLGVRREAEPVNQAEKAEDDLEAAREAKQELSMCRKPAEFERWAIKWGRTLCEIAGAR